MSYSGPVTLYEREGWTLESYGKGAAYTLRRVLADGGTKSVFFQGDDAGTLRAEVMDDDGWLIEGKVCGVPRLHVAFQEYLGVMTPDEPAE